uniref:Uncharacterized protein n=1 Tax=Rhizophora mucronata TaxID=61149 RepID=A0A2P2PTM3_RHIMU
MYNKLMSLSFQDFFPSLGWHY